MPPAGSYTLGLLKLKHVRALAAYMCTQASHVYVPFFPLCVAMCASYQYMHCHVSVHVY